MNKTDFIEVSPPLGSIIVLSGNYHLISPAFDENCIIQQLDFHHNHGGTYCFYGDDARRIAGILNNRFSLHIGAKSMVELDKVREIKSSLDEPK